jgi:hypothetical protein
MRRTPAFFVLLAIAILSIGCAKSDQSGAANSNAPGTTTYSNSNVSPSTTTAAPSGGGAANSNAPRIKPPTDK